MRLGLLTAPFPETLILGAPDFFLKKKMASQTKSKTLDEIDPRALDDGTATYPPLGLQSLSASLPSSASRKR